MGSKIVIQLLSNLFGGYYGLLLSKKWKIYWHVRWFIRAKLMTPPVNDGHFDPRAPIRGQCVMMVSFRWILSDSTWKKTDGYDGDDDLWTSMIYDDQTMMIFDDLWITTMIYDLVMVFEYLWWSMIQSMIDQTLCWCHRHGSFKMFPELNALNLRSQPPW